MPKKNRESIARKAPAKSANAEEEALFIRCKAGDAEARDALFERYSPWAVNIARKYHACFPQVALGELVAEGNRGIVEALKRFDRLRRTKFSTYAWFWIMKNIQQYIATSIGIIGVPRSVVSDLKKIVTAMDDDIKKGNELSLDSLSRKLKLDNASLRELLTDRKNVIHPVSLDKPINDYDETALSAMIEDTSQPSVQEIVDQVGDAASMTLLLERLEPKEREIIRLRFGFNDNRYCSLREVGQRLNILPTKVKDIESIALFKLKKILAESDRDD